MYIQVMYVRENPIDSVGRVLTTNESIKHRVYNQEWTTDYLTFVSHWVSRS